MNSNVPLHQFSRFSSTNVDETLRNVTNVFCPHQFELLEHARSFAAQLNEAKFSQSALVYISYGTAVNIQTEQLGNCFLIQVPWQGQAEVAVENVITHIQPGIASVVSPEQAMNMRWSNDCSFFTVRLDRQKVERKLSQLIGHELHDPLTFDTKFDLTTAEGKSWMNAVNFAKQQLELPLNPIIAKPLLQQIEDTLCLMLLQLPHHNYRDKLNVGHDNVTPRSVKRARDYIHDNIHLDISLEQLAMVTGVVPSTLNKHFSHFIGQSPMKYIRGQKLAAVHEVLQSSNENVSVTDVAIKYGFNHLGRFAEYYKRRYGERPSDTLQRSK
ncbi:AraC family transcriptional regulator [Aliiglaciecola sp. 3_MG-2023]|uniref:AraC family transcriptional regulator n=1 Tax=Aliiglaciecola sp. 3_MG-2023 TaxID=3062644 RepID=UPI0026E298DC|nr:AraC family transcriptional regulator [Aliiglaciecola sp. 3_MG-2023]MDO6694747.1 AraC family transcriptional regulator [Aliiglaciecola sp. 3_MG-2023]